MSVVKNFQIIKTVPGTVIFNLHPISNPTLSRRVMLTNQNPKQSLPLDWALGIFADAGTYSLYQNKSFTFDNNEAIVKAAFENGVYFDDKLDFEPAQLDRTETIFAVLQGGNRQAILKLIDEEGSDAVKDVAIAKADNLTNGVNKMLESIFKIQLTVDGE